VTHLQDATAYPPQKPHEETALTFFLLLAVINFLLNITKIIYKNFTGSDCTWTTKETNSS